VFDRIELSVTDVARSAASYRAALAPLGVEQGHESTETAELGALTRVRRPPRERLQIAFLAETRDGVDGFHRAGRAAGGSDNGAPGLRDYAADYCAAYLLDPAGHNVEAAQRSPETRAGWTWLGLGVVGD
jgi:catechol 2,3-dioxygenase-like lactoylglutathione lyase family enzyme